MLAPFAYMWRGKLGRTEAVQHRIALTQNSHPICSAPYRGGPKTRKLEELENRKQLKAGVIEPAMSSWASSELFFPKKD